MGRGLVRPGRGTGRRRWATGIRKMRATYDSRGEATQWSRRPATAPVTHPTECPRSGPRSTAAERGGRNEPRGVRLRRVTRDPRALEGHRSRPATCSAPAGRVSSLLKRSGATAAVHTSQRLLRVPPIRLLPLSGIAHASDDAASPMRTGKTHRLKTCATRRGSEGLPVPGSRRSRRRMAAESLDMAFPRASPHRPPVTGQLWKFRDTPYSCLLQPQGLKLRLARVSSHSSAGVTP